MFSTGKPYLSIGLGAAVLIGCASSPSRLEACPNASLPCADPAVSVMALSDDDGVLQMTGNAAALKFTEIFGYPVPPTIIVPGGSVSGETFTDLTANGFKTVMPWISAADRLKLVESAISKQAETQTNGLPVQVLEAARQQMLSQANASATTESQAKEAGALAHELSHLWFMARFTKEGEAAWGHAYGGWAPDWLDETAAVLLENDTLKDIRRSRFYKLDADQRFPLSQFLVMDHPGAKAVDKSGLRNAKDQRLEAPKLAGKGTEIVSSMRVLTGEEAKAFRKASGGDRSADFYAQVLIFSEYLTARAGDTTVFPDIAEQLAAGKSISGWLADNRFSLPRTVSELEADWTAWILESGTQ